MKKTLKDFLKINNENFSFIISSLVPIMVSSADLQIVFANSVYTRNHKEYAFVLGKD